MDSKDRKELLNKIRELEFAAVELNLFLDNNPRNKKALADFNAITCELEKLRKIYEKQYGPLANFGMSMSDYPWAWVNDPWPWEIGE